MTAPRYRWQPSTEEIARRAGIPVDRVIRFDHNTSPRRPEWAPEVACEAARRVNEYPAADYTPLREAIATHHGVAPEMVVPGAGADELILLCAKAFLQPGDRAVGDVPAYPLYEIATVERGARFEGIARDADLAYPTGRLADAAASADLVWTCVPHNPVGDRPSGDSLGVVREAAAGLVVIDAAYAEFTDDRAPSLSDDDEDVIVLGTLSKAFGLAGIRVGYAIASVARATALHRVRPPGSVSSISAAMAIAALHDPSWMTDNVATIITDRADLVGKLDALGIVTRPTVTNFVLARVPDAHGVERRLMDRGTVVRRFPGDHSLADHLRFTVRSPDEHDRLVTELEEALT